MRVPPLCTQAAALVHTEAVLLIRNNQPQVGKHGALGDQGVGSHHNVGLSRGQCFPGCPLFLLGLGTVEQHRVHTQRSKELAQGFIVLLCQNFRRGHKGRLETVQVRTVRRRSGDHGLAAAHIALDQPVHGRALLKIPQYFLNSPLLRPRQ